MSTLPIITIVITTYKRPATLGRAIMSVLRQNGIEQSRVEIIVVDDNNSGDEYRVETELLMQRFAKNKFVKYIQHEKNRNGAAARNTGLRAARGRYLTFLDDDDIFMPGRLMTLIEVLDKKPTYHAVYSGYAYARNNRVVKATRASRPEDCIYDLLCQKSFFGTGSNMIFRTVSLKQINGFDERFERHQDVEVMIRFVKRSTVTLVPDIFVVKCIDSTLNVPNAQKMERVKRLFLSTFENVINEYDNNRRKEIYRSNYMELARVTAWNRAAPSKWAQEKINEYGGLGIKGYLAVIAKRLQAKYSWVDDIRYGIGMARFNEDEKNVAQSVANTIEGLEREDV